MTLPVGTTVKVVAVDSTYNGAIGTVVRVDTALWGEAPRKYPNAVAVAASSAPLYFSDSELKVVAEAPA